MNIWRIVSVFLTKAKCQMTYVCEEKGNTRTRSGLVQFVRVSASRRERQQNCNEHHGDCETERSPHHRLHDH
jgi:hypothetical protein